MICRLCLKNLPDLVNIFDGMGIELNMAQVLTKYFWFEPKDDDPISTAVCHPCWNAVSNFHEFYLTVEDAHRLLTERFSLRPSNNRLPSESTETKRDRLEHTSDTKFETSTELSKNANEIITNAVNNHEELTQDAVADDEDAFSGYSHVFNEDEEEFLNVSVAIPPTSEQKSAVRRSMRLKPNETATKQMSESVTTTSTNTPLNSPSKEPTKRFAKKSQESDEKRIAEKSVNKKAESLASNQSINKTTASTNEIDDNIASYMQIRCELCNKTPIANFSQLRIHMQEVHDSKAFVTCCNKKFFKRALLSDHIKKHMNPDCFRCDDCDKVFSDKQCLRNHLLVKHQPDEKKTYSCPHCPKMFAKQYLVEQHRIIHDARTHTCPECKKGFASNCLLKTHIKLVHKDYGTMCDICAKVIRGKAAFARHQLEHTNLVVPKVQCNLCGSWHKDKYTLQKHKRRHNDAGIEHACNICGKISPNRSALLSHHRYVHASKRTYECGVCKKAFKKPLALKEHMALHTGEVLYKCPHCTKTFNSNANMHSHRKKAHPKEFEETRIQRRENSAKPSILHTKSIETIPSEIVVEVDSGNKDTVPQYITIATREEDGDNIETHSILVTTADDDFNDESDFTGDSIIFTVQ